MLHHNDPKMTCDLFGNHLRMVGSIPVRYQDWLPTVKTKMNLAAFSRTGVVVLRPDLQPDDTDVLNLLDGTALGPAQKAKIKNP